LFFGAGDTAEGVSEGTAEGRAFIRREVKVVDRFNFKLELCDGELKHTIRIPVCEERVDSKNR
jgi:hypothetical protein